MSRGSAQSVTLAGAAASADLKVGHSSRTARMSRCNGDSDLPMSNNPAVNNVLVEGIVSQIWFEENDLGRRCLR